MGNYSRLGSNDGWLASVNFFAVDEFKHNPNTTNEVAPIFHRYTSSSKNKMAKPILKIGTSNIKGATVDTG